MFYVSISSICLLVILLLLLSEFFSQNSKSEFRIPIQRQVVVYITYFGARDFLKSRNLQESSKFDFIQVACLFCLLFRLFTLRLNIFFFKPSFRFQILKLFLTGFLLGFFLERTGLISVEFFNIQ